MTHGAHMATENRLILGISKRRNHYSRANTIDTPLSVRMEEKCASSMGIKSKYPAELKNHFPDPKASYFFKRGILGQDSRREFTDKIVLMEVH